MRHRRLVSGGKPARSSETELLLGTRGGETVRKRLVVLALLGLMLAGCQPASTTVSTIATPTIVSWSSPVHWVGPGRVDIGHMYLGATADTWVSSTTLDNGYQYIAGEPLCFTIYNDEESSKRYNIELDSGNYGQPLGYANWIDISAWSVAIPARSAINIPIRIVIPSKVTVPISPQWEFRVDIIASGQGNVQYAEAIRFVISMR